MIKFFRKIRQKLLSEDKPALPAGRFSKYLIYAVGEIILVVIGILIALQVNNWNEQQKVNHLERNYLERISQDLVSDSLYLIRRIKESTALIKSGKDFPLKAYKTQKSFDEYMNLINSLSWNSEHFVVQKSTFDELNNSGNFNILSNPKLKNTILKHYLKYETDASHIKEMNEFSQITLEKIITILFKGWNTVDVNSELNIDTKMDWKYINDPASKKFIDMETAVRGYTGKHETFNSYFKESLIRIRLLLKEIDVELNK